MTENNEDQQPDDNHRGQNEMRGRDDGANKVSVHVTSPASEVAEVDTSARADTSPASCKSQPVAIVKDCFKPHEGKPPSTTGQTPHQPTTTTTSTASGSAATSTATGVQPTGQANIEQQLSKAKRDLESMVLKYARSESENLQHKAKSEELDRKLKRAVKDNESLANRIKILANDKIQLSDTLSAKVAQLTVLEQKNCSLSHVQDVKLKELEAEVGQLRSNNEELLKSIETYKSKENELLDFSERLSMKQLLLQSELDKAMEEAPDYKKRYNQLVTENVELKDKIEQLTEECSLSNDELNRERRLVDKLREEKNELEVKSRRGVDELENEMKVLRRKHQVATRELLKQLRYLQQTAATRDEKCNTQGELNKVIT